MTWTQIHHNIKRGSSLIDSSPARQRRSQLAAGRWRRREAQSHSRPGSVDTALRKQIEYGVPMGNQSWFFQRSFILSTHRVALHPDWRGG